ncbi:hypothetical protein F4803DRAFT_294367 [Xylaria telfairii]|nr:hypothetical protein F4803DRAFT_294367 [Xylaria telfairii]
MYLPRPSRRRRYLLQRRAEVGGLSGLVFTATNPVNSLLGALYSTVALSTKCTRPDQARVGNPSWPRTLGAWDFGRTLTSSATGTGPKWALAVVILRDSCGVQQCQCRGTVFHHPQLAACSSQLGAVFIFQYSTVLRYCNVQYSIHQPAKCQGAKCQVVATDGRHGAVGQHGSFARRSSPWAGTPQSAYNRLIDC